MIALLLLVVERVVPILAELVCFVMPPKIQMVFGLTSRTLLKVGVSSLWSDAGDFFLIEDILPSCAARMLWVSLEWAIFSLAMQASVCFAYSTVRP